MPDAIREASATRPDRILMDFRIWDRDGSEALDCLRRDFGLPIVFLKAQYERDTMEPVESTPPTAFLAKPFRLVELIQAVEITLDQSRIKP